MMVQTWTPLWWAFFLWGFFIGLMALSTLSGMCSDDHVETWGLISSIALFGVVVTTTVLGAEAGWW